MTADPSRTPASGRTFRTVLPRGLSLLLVPVMLLSLWSIRQEWLVRQAEQRLAYQSRLLGSSGEAGAGPRLKPRPRPLFAPPRYLLADALTLAYQAAQVPDAKQRLPLLVRAREEAQEALASRPHWGEAAIAIAYVASLRSSPMGETERDALVRSYLDAPYMPGAGLWRISRGLAFWNSFPPTTQGAVIRESLWFLCKANKDTRKRLFAMARASAAYVPFFISYGRSTRCR